MTEHRPMDIREHVLQYAVRAVQLGRTLYKHKDPAARMIGRQFLRSATSIGANLEEARSGESRADFLHKHAIAQKEVRESLCWLKLLTEAGIIKTDLLTSLLRETNEIIAIFTTIIVRTKENNRET